MRSLAQSSDSAQLHTIRTSNLYESGLASARLLSYFKIHSLLFLFAKNAWYIMRERYSRWCKSPLKFKRRERPTSVGDGAISLIGRAGLNTRGHECTLTLIFEDVEYILTVTIQKLNRCHPQQINRDVERCELTL